MKKLLCLVFALVMLCSVVLAFNVFAEDEATDETVNTNIANQATVTTNNSHWQVVGADWCPNTIPYLTDGNPLTGIPSCAKSNTNVQTFTFAEKKFVEKIVLLVNGYGKRGNIDTVSEESPVNINANYIVKAYDVDGKEVYKLTLNSADKTELIYEFADPMYIKKVVVEYASGWNWGAAFLREVEIHEKVVAGECEEHTPEKVVTTDATCTKNGEYSMVCTACGAVVSTSEIPALGHTMGDEYRIKTPATCITAPVIEYDCTVCGEVAERDPHVEDVTDYIDLTTVKTDGAGGWTTSYMALFDNNMDSYLMASGGWFVQTEAVLDRNYYISSVTIWAATNSDSSWLILYYKAPNGDGNWIEAGKVHVPDDAVASSYTLELAEPVYASEIKVFVGGPDGLSHGGGPGVASYSGCVYEAKVTGSLVADTAAGHTWVAGETVAPTCTVQGYTKYTCSVCSAEKTADYVKWTGHSYTYACDKICIVCNEESRPNATHTIEHVDAKAATCTENGNVEYWYCSVCGYAWLDEACTLVTNQMSVVVPAAHSYFYECDKVCQVCFEETNPEATHTIEHVDAVAATCTENGNVEYWYCSDCGSAWTDEALTQVTNQRSVVVPAAHSYFYECDKVCQVCFEVTNPDATHTIEHVDAVAATCTENGNVEYWYCTVCGYAWLDEACTLVANQMSIVVPAAHEWDEGYFMGWPYPSCQNPVGTKTYTCNVCYETYDEENVSVDINDIQWHAAELEWETAVDANCQTAGYKKYTCSDCGKVFEIVTEADTENGHEWIADKSKSYDATCIADGYSFQTCSICNTTRELVLDKEFYGKHQYGYDPETYVEATCQQDGYAEYTCELCGDSYEETTSAGAWLHEWVNSSNGLIQTCSVCDEVSFGNGQLSGVENDMTAMFVWNGTGLNIWNSEFDVYYSFELVSAENGVYTLTLISEGDLFDGATAVLTTVADGGTLVVTTADGTASYTFENKAPDFNYLLNGTYAYYDMMGSVLAMFKFENGTITVLADNMGIGFPATFAYKYDPYTGTISTPEVPFANFSEYDGVIYFGRGFELVPCEEPTEPDEPVNYGDKIGSITVETTDTYGWFDFYSYTADKAGKYTFYVPAGLGFFKKAEYDVYGNADADFYDNANGVYVEVELAAGETLEFYVGALTKDTWTIDVYFYTEHVHTEVEIPAIRPTPSVKGFTAGIVCSDCGEVIKAAVEINVTEMADTKDPNFRIASASLDLAESICVFYKSIVTTGYNNAYMVFVFGGEEFVVTDYTIEAGTGRYVYRFTGAPAYKMAENIEAYVYAETAEGEYSVNCVLEYSVMTYCVNQLKKNSSDPVYVNVISDVLTLGAANQVFEGYKADALVTDLVEAKGYTLTPTAFTSVDASKNVQSLTGDRTQGTDWKAAGMLLGSNIKVQLKFESNNIDNVTVKVNVAGEDRYFTAEDFTMDGNRYVVTVDYLTSKQYDEVITGTFYVDGEQIGSTLTYSVNSYICRNVSSATGAKLTLLQAIYVYGETMKAFFK